MERPGRRSAELDGAETELYKRDHIVLHPHVEGGVDLAPVVDRPPVAILMVDVPAAPVRQASPIAARQQVVCSHDGWLAENTSQRGHVGSAARGRRPVQLV